MLKLKENYSITSRINTAYLQSSIPMVTLICGMVWDEVPKMPAIVGSSDPTV